MYGNDTHVRRIKGRLPRTAPTHIVVTGGAGFIGSHMVDALLCWFPRSRVTVLDAFTYAANPENLSHALRSGRLHLVRGSIEDQELLASLITSNALVLHLAAESHVPRSFVDPVLFDRVNREGTRRLLDAALTAGAHRVIHFSTDEVYGSRMSPADETSPLMPTTPYAQSKVAAEVEVDRARARGLDVTVLRPSNVIGTRQHKEKLVPCFVSMARAGEAFHLEGDGHQRRTFLTVSDLVNAMDVILRKAEPSGTYNVVGAQTLSVVEVAGIVAHAMKTPLRFSHVGDRPVNDRAYMLNGARLAALGFRAGRKLESVVRELIAEGQLSDALSAHVHSQPFLEGFRISAAQCWASEPV